MTVKFQHLTDSENFYLRRTTEKGNCCVTGANWRLITLALSIIVYLLIGALTFPLLERRVLARESVKITQIKEDFLERNPCIKDDDLESFITAVIQAQKRGVSAIKNVSSEANWSFGQAFFFSGTIITTIGYGHVTPLSKGGKIFCIVYALLGIPLTMLMLQAFVERLMVPSTLFLQFLNSKLGHLYQPFNIRIFHLCILGALILGLFFFVPAAIFSHLEPDWDFSDSLYYCFISLTTIGLGDYIPGDSPNQQYRPLYKISTVFYLMLGLTAMMYLLHVFAHIPQLNFGIFFLLRSEEQCTENEKMRITTGMMGPKYTTGKNETRQNIQVKSHLEESPSPEDTTPIHARP